MRNWPVVTWLAIMGVGLWAGSTWLWAFNLGVGFGVAAVLWDLRRPASQ